MNFELTPNTGAVFKVQNKPSDRLPDYEGHVNIDGKVLRVVGWKRYGRKSGKQYMSLLFTELTNPLPQT
ncbi:MAG TPA: hypothetical protein PK079_06480 [Leptospiraceae bacterium]|nr:hypothetical protein [Leptospiraceae bacterium]HMW06586.1 hypothetical protein [Leptospiraceae bacterium]HMX34984.1 hypothetical protein [Leptospiraceae bacterium]HMY31223.1 hypothetical protein [Leptospiraceae bacterium]HMZ63290.1 hypothetical protein [Leptospiraceae bacterium]